jgi:nucleoside-diphosphate-sugar epimerase
MNVNIPLIYENPRSGDIRDSVSDITKVNKSLGFKPNYTLDTGLEETINWFKI